MNALYPTRQVWGITYYKKNPCYLIRGGHVLLDPRFRWFDDFDDEYTPALAIEAEHPATVADLCTGRGLTLLAAHKYGATFYGTELNKRRLAVAIDRATKQGIRYEKYPVQ
jgi:methylase of polypeptide subunit release factors